MQPIVLGYKGGRQSAIKLCKRRQLIFQARTYTAFSSITPQTRMADYTLTADGSRHFNLTAADHKLGELTYEKWFSLEATILLAGGAQFQLKPKGFWGTTIELQREGVTLLHFSMGWNGKIIIQSSLPDQPQDFIFMQRSFFKNEYALTDSQGLELLVIQPDFKWTKLSYNYRISTTDLFEALTSKEVFLLLAAHCANYYMTMMMAAV